MPIVTVTAADRAGFLDLVNAEIRPDRAKTNAWDDFPVILGPQNSAWQLVFKTAEGALAGCIAALIRYHKTNCGEIAVAGIGSVVTAPEFRGRGVSKALQNEMLARLKRQNVPLAVLWTDQPAIYAGRGFRAAGWEIHANVKSLTLPGPLSEGLKIEEFNLSQSQAVQSLFDGHRYRTVRQPGDCSVYYAMPGTRGFVVTNTQDQVQAAVFCGKGGDFPDYVPEWSGPPELVIHLLAHVRDQGLAHGVLIPAGAEALVDSLVDLGAAWAAQPSGFWALLDVPGLGKLIEQAGGRVPATIDPESWLGRVDSSGRPETGPLTAAIWGFDSV